MAIIIVGNSPKLLGKGMGKFIDSFDTVVRMNNAQAGGEWEDDFGNKTDILFSTQAFNRHLNPKKHIFFIPHLMNRMDPYVQKVYKHLRETYDIYPSTGIVCIHYFLEFYDKVNIINFDFQIGYAGTNKHHHYYIDNDKPDNVTHSFEKERDIVNSLDNVIIH